MIIELAIGAAILTAGGVLVRTVSKRGHSKTSSTANQKPARTAQDGLLVGDVVLYLGEEYWLAGGLELWEQDFVCRLFRTPGTTDTTWLLQLDRSANHLALLQETDDVPGGSVPNRLPIGGMQLSLQRRGRAQVRRDGEHLPSHLGQFDQFDQFDQAEFTLLGGPGRQLLVLDFDNGTRLALAGRPVAREMVELLPTSR